MPRRSARQRKCINYAEPFDRSVDVDGAIEVRHSSRSDGKVEMDESQPLAAPTAGAAADSVGPNDSPYFIPTDDRNDDSDFEPEPPGSSLSSSPILIDDDADEVDTLFALQHPSTQPSSASTARKRTLRSHPNINTLAFKKVKTNQKCTAIYRTVSKRTPVTVSKSEAIDLENSLDGFQSPAKPKTSAFDAMQPHKRKSQTSTFDDTKITAMRVVLGASLSDRTLMQFLNAASGNEERAISNILDSPSLSMQLTSASQSRSMSPSSQSQPQPWSVRHIETNAASPVFHSGPLSSVTRLDSSKAIVITQPPKPRSPPSRPDSETVELLADDDYDNEPYIKPQSSLPLSMTMKTDEERESERGASVIEWDRKLLVTIQVDANCTTVGKQIVKPGEHIQFRDQSRDSMLALLYHPRSVKKLRAGLKKAKKAETRILRFVQLSAPANAIEIGSLPKSVSDVLVPLFDRHFIEIDGQVASHCPVHFDILTNIPLLLSVYAKPALFQYRRAVTVETKGWFNRVLNVASDADLNPIDTFIGLLEAFHITPIQSSIKEEEIKLDRAPPIVYDERKSVRESESVNDDDNEAPVYEEEIEAAKEMASAVDTNDLTIIDTNTDSDKDAVKMSGFQLHALYASAQNQWRDLPELAPSSRLKATLRHYQQQALYWMVNRERGDNDSDSENAEHGKVRRLHPLWECYAFETGENFYVNPFSSQVSLTFPEATGMALGGVLADEMGLGKTIQSIALICHSHSHNAEEMASVPSDNVSAKPSNDSDDVTDSLTRHRTATRTTLIVVPMTLISQWRDEIHRFSDLSVYVYYADKRADVSALRHNDVVITSYGTLSQEAKQSQSSNSSARAPLITMQWHRVILDEAHIIRNRLTEQSKACYLLNATHRWCLTGTPIQNKLEDVFPLLHFLREDPWSDLGWWRRVIEKPFHQADPKALQRLKAVLQPLLLRRTKDMKASDGSPIVELPPRVESILLLDFTAEERDFYDALYTQSKTQIDGYVKEGSILNKYIQVLTLILRLRQAADHPFLCIGREKSEEEWESDVNKFIQRFAAKVVDKPSAIVAPTSHHQPSLEYIQSLQSTIAKMREAHAPKSNPFTPAQPINSETDRENCDASQDTASSNSNNDDEAASPWQECPICLSPPEDPVLTPCGHVYCRACAIELCGLSTKGRCCICRSFYEVHRLTAIPQPKPKILIDFRKEFKHSTKTARLLAELKALKSEDPSIKSLVFSQWTSMLDLLEIPLKTEGFEFLRLDGSLSQKQRETILKRFKSEPTMSILLISLKTGGVGLNLVAASCVFFLDCWWNPAVERQAIDRVHRIGQTRTVRVKRFVVRDTVEDRILQLQHSKMQLANSVHSHSHDTDAGSGRVDVRTLLECLK